MTEAAINTNRYAMAADISAPSYVADGVHFTAASLEYISRGAGLTGAADNGTGLFSFWFNRSTTGTMYLLHAAGARYQIFFQGDHTLRIIADQEDSTALMDVTSGSTFSSAGWHHCFCSFDLSSTSNRALYIDGVDDTPTWNTYTTSGTVDWTRTDLAIGSTVTPTQHFDGCLSEFYFTNEYLAASNISSFISGGKPVSLGGDGSTPTGTAPLVYLKTSYTAFGSNSGSGGDFTINNGPLAACASRPTD